MENVPKQEEGQVEGKRLKIPNNFFSLLYSLESTGVKVPNYYFNKYKGGISNFARYNEEHNIFLSMARKGFGSFESFFTVSNYPVLVFSDENYSNMLQRANLFENILAFNAGNYIATSESCLEDPRFLERLLHEFIHALQFCSDLEIDSLDFENMDLEKKLVKMMKIELEAYLSSFDFYKNELCTINQEWGEKDSLIYHIIRLTNLKEDLTEDQQQLLLKIMPNIQNKLKELSPDKLEVFLELFDNVETLQELNSKLEL
jgi:hypothetical protein